MVQMKKQQWRWSARPICIDLFAGAGGLMLGLEEAGFRTIVANEIHPDPCLTLKTNFPATPVLQSDIRLVTGQQLLDASGHRGEVDLVAGGPPCQGFSNAGLKDPTDPRNGLIGEFIRIVREIKPRFFVLENVVGLTTLHSGRLFRNVLAELDSLRYGFRHTVLFAADFGVPQMRKRLIVIGAREGHVPPHPEPTHRACGDATLFDWAKPTYVNVGDAIDDLPAILPGQSAEVYQSLPRSQYQQRMRKRGGISLFNHEAAKHKAETMAYYALIPPGGTWLDIPEKLRKKKQGIQRWPINGLARTITTEPTDFLHPTLHRVPTVRETARIQSFPDWYKFEGQRTTGNKMRRLGYCSQTQQVGNSVPPLLAQAIGESILRYC